jgi:SAM-dependent methyltransferase
LLFDAIVTSDVVEHVSNPELLLVRLMGLLAKDGVLIITTGDADNFLWNFFGANWWYCFIAEHVSFISKSWLDHFAKKHNAQILYFKTFHYDRFGVLKYIIDFLLTVFYGIAPCTYLHLGKMVKKMFGRTEEFVARGVGISADHIFVVMSHKDSM